MNRTLSFFVAMLVAMTITVAANAQEREISVVLPDAESAVSYPLSVMSIINHKCYGCHQPEAQGEKSREALQWIKLQSMDDIDLLATMDEIIEVLDKGEMPPEKAVEKYPQLKLTDDEVAKLKMWAEGVMAKFDE